jgi:hypothetical protein
MIELLLPCGFDTLEYSWVKATIGICMLTDYSMAKKHNNYQNLNLGVELHTQWYLPLQLWAPY